MTIRKIDNQLMTDYNVFKSSFLLAMPGLLPNPLLFKESPMSTKKSVVSVAKFLDNQITMSSKTQIQISEEIGYDKPNIISMMKQGKTKLPVNKIVPMAKALGVDPVYFMRLVLSEYQPDLCAALDMVYSGSLVSAQELAMIEAVREASDGIDIAANPEFLSQVAAVAVQAAKPIAMREGKTVDDRADALRNTTRKAA